jgi:hypothetical protein
MFLILTICSYSFSLNQKRAVIRLADTATRLSNVIYSINSSPVCFPTPIVFIVKYTIIPTETLQLGPRDPFALGLPKIPR